MIAILHSYWVCYFKFTKKATCRRIECASAIARGLNLGPLMFIIFVNYLADYCKVNETVQLYLYADDLEMVQLITDERDCDVLQFALIRLNEWCEVNKVLLNDIF